MSLILPPWQFANSVSNFTGTPPPSGPGTTFTAAANNTDGAEVEVLSALAFDVHYLIVGFAGVSIANSSTHCLADILTDPAGGTSYGSFIDDLLAGYTPASNPETGSSCWYHFPIWIPAGSAIAVRAQQSAGSSATGAKVIVHAFGNPSRPEMWWCGRKVESLGINVATSKGTDITPGTSGADGTWTTIGTSSHRYGAVQAGVNGTDAASLALGHYFDVGIGSAQVPFFPRFFKALSTSERGAQIGPVSPIFCDVAAGTTWQMRATCSGTPETWNVALYGVY